MVRSFLSLSELEAICCYFILLKNNIEFSFQR